MTSVSRHPAPPPLASVVKESAEPGRNKAHRGIIRVVNRSVYEVDLHSTHQRAFEGSGSVEWIKVVLLKGPESVATENRITLLEGQNPLPRQNLEHRTSRPIHQCCLQWNLFNQHHRNEPLSAACRLFAEFIVLRQHKYWIPRTVCTLNLRVRI